MASAPEPMDVFFEIHRDLPQEGPGSDEATLQALSSVGVLPTPARVLDIGCGPGRQTLTLAERTSGHITAIDTHRPYLDQLRRRAEARGLTERIATMRCSMNALPFEEGSFDLIWAEGSVYIMGLSEGLDYWRRFLKPEGVLALTELCWLVDSPPEQAHEFFRKAYPAMRTLHQNLETITRSGYSTLAVSTLPESAWWDSYYTPMEERIRELRDRYASEPEILETLAAEQKEIDLYRRHSDAYGYVFFIMRKKG